jgi:hypothetical protein
MADLHSIKTRWSLKKRENKIKKCGFQTLILSQVFRHQVCQHKNKNSHYKRENISTKYISHKHNGGGSRNISYAHILIPLALEVQIMKFRRHIYQHCPKTSSNVWQTRRWTRIPKAYCHTQKAASRIRMLHLNVHVGNIHYKVTNP